MQEYSSLALDVMTKAEALLAKDSTQLHDIEHPLLQSLRPLAEAACSADDSIRGPALGAIFGDIVEAANDRLTESGRALYAVLFPAIIWFALENNEKAQEYFQRHDIKNYAVLLAHYQRARHIHNEPQHVPSENDEPKTIVLLSRVTIGADILLNSVLIQHLQKRWPAAKLILLGSGKLEGLLGGISNLSIAPLSYARRGGLDERLQSIFAVEEAISELHADLVISPDSRLDQLGILPCTTQKYALWENTRADAGPASSLAAQLDTWCAKFCGHDFSACPQIFFPKIQEERAAHWKTLFADHKICAVKFDHGGNAQKSCGLEFEVAVMKQLQSNGWKILLDRGFGDEELAASDELVKATGLNCADYADSDENLGQNPYNLNSLENSDIIRYHCSIANWASAVQSCQHAISYDSVGQHLAAALGTPLLVLFAGFGDPAFPIAWAPQGKGDITVIEFADEETTEQRLGKTLPNLPK